MKKAICVFSFCLTFILSVTAAQAASNPTIAGTVGGRELCPQFICGAAIFAGAFQGRVGIIPNAVGIIATAMNHGELPTAVGSSTPIFPGGVWGLQTFLRRFNGVVLGGQITYMGDNRFHVTATLLLTEGGTGTLNFDGILDHNPLIPTFGGALN